MASRAFPLLKLFGVFVKQVSGPVSKYIQKEAQQRPLLRNKICVPLGQAFNRFDTRVRMWLYNVGRPVKIPPLTEEMAVRTAANLLGEMFVFVVTSAVVLEEYEKSVRKEKIKEDMRRKEIASLNEISSELLQLTTKTKKEIDETWQLLEELYPDRIRKIIGSKITNSAKDVE